MAKSLYEAMKDCQKEEEVKSEFCKFFKMKINALKAIDHYTPNVLFEFKLDRNFRKTANIAVVIAQTMYYARLLKFSLTKFVLPPYICVVDKNEAFFIETKTYAKFYSSTAAKYDWDRAASTPCPNLVLDIASELADATKRTPPYVYDLTLPAEEDQFVAKCRERLVAQMTFLELLDKKSITEENFLDVFEYWDSLFGKYVKNGRKSSEYFLADIEQGKSISGSLANTGSGTWPPEPGTWSSSCRVPLCRTAMSRRLRRTMRSTARRSSPRRLASSTTTWRMTFRNLQER